MMSKMFDIQESLEASLTFSLAILLELMRLFFLNLHKFLIDVSLDNSRAQSS